MPTMIVSDRLEAWVVDRVRELLAGGEVRAERGATAELAKTISAAEADLDTFMLAHTRDRRGGLRQRGLASGAAASRAARIRPFAWPVEGKPAHREVRT